MASRLASAAAGACGGAAAVLLGLRLRGAPDDSSTDDAPSTVLAERRFCKYGLPSDEHVIVRNGYASSISYRLRIPNWVAEHYSRSDTDAEGVDRKHSRFSADEAVPAAFRAANEDYFGSGLSRGHLAPAGAHKQSQAALDETFKLSANILPQELSNNGSDWLRLERWSRGLLKQYEDVYVISGPLFLPAEPVAPPAAAESPPEAKPPRAPPQRRRVAYDVIGPHGVAVPTHLFKVVLAERPVSAAAPPRRLSAFVLPNGPLAGHPDLDDFVVPLATVEKASGLELFARLGEARHEAEVTPPLCAGGEQARCGVGAMDGRIVGWKRLGHLKLAEDCQQLKQAWGEVSAGAENSGLMRRVYEEKAGPLACPLALPTPPARA